MIVGLQHDLGGRADGIAPVCHLRAGRSLVACLPFVRAAMLLRRRWISLARAEAFSAVPATKWPSSELGSDMIEHTAPAEARQVGRVAAGTVEPHALLFDRFALALRTKVFRLDERNPEKFLELV